MLTKTVGNGTRRATGRIDMTGTRANLIEVADQVLEFTTPEVAVLITPPVSRFTIMREIERGNLAAQKGGGRWLVERGEALRWAASYRPYQSLRKSGPPADVSRDSSPE
jgi:hypothetical protein